MALINNTKKLLDNLYLLLYNESVAEIHLI